VERGRPHGRADRLRLAAAHERFIGPARSGPARTFGATFLHLPAGELLARRRRLHHRRYVPRRGDRPDGTRLGR
jgi:hypothetical protein